MSRFACFGSFRSKLQPDHFCRKLLLYTCLALMSFACLAQSTAGAARPMPAALPPWAVLVLKPIGAERVRPVTGVVVSEQGLVIVPLDFAAPGDQIIVLDGGTDIIANGRAATIRKQFPDAGLTVLSAPALKRRPATLAAAPLADGAEIRLAAFPPAELIAQGAAPVSVLTRVTTTNTVAGKGDKAPAMTAIATAKALPNVTGPLIDGCGNLVGFSSADGVQSMDTSKAPAYLWKDGLLQALHSLSVNLIELPCPAIEPATAEERPPVAESAEVTQPEPDATTDVAEANTTAERGGVAEEHELPSALVTTPWILWLGLVLAVVLAGWAFRRHALSTRRDNLPGRGRMPADKQESARSAAAGAGSDAGAEPSDCVVEIRGRLPNGTPFTGSCEANGAAINVVIGRGGRTDINIDSQDVHREHVRLSGSADALTISDLGSARGTWVNRVPCLKGEIMFIAAEDTIFLGDVSFQVAVRPRQSGDSEARGN